MEDIYTETRAETNAHNGHRFRALVENSSDAIILRDEKFHIIYCSPASERILGWTNEERCLETTKDVIHPDDVENMSALKEYVLSNPGMPVQMTYRIRHKKGHYIWSDGIMTNWLHDVNVNAIVSNVRDVTERKKAEQQLAESERGYRTLFEQNISGVFQTTTGGDIRTCNQSFACMLGYDSPQELLKINAAALYFFTGEREQFINNLREQKKMYNNEVLLKKKDGSPLYALENISLFVDPVTGEELCDGVLIDITEKKKSEETAMLINNRIYQQQKTLLELSSLKINIPFDEKVRIIIEEGAKTMNAQRASLWSYNATKTSITTEYIYCTVTNQNLPGMSLHKTDDPGYFKMLDGYNGNIGIDRMTDAADPSFINSHIHAEGITSIEYVPVRKGENIIGFICYEYAGPKRMWLNSDNIFTRSIADIISMTMDREEIRRTEQALHQSEERYRQIVETAQEGIWLIDENNYTVFVNKKMCEMLEYTQEEMLGRQNYEFKNAEEKAKAIVQIERRKQGISEMHDSSYVTKSGGIFWASVSSNPILNPDGSYAGALAMVTDIRKRKEDEALLQQSEAKLALKNEELEIKNKELEQFVYIASHDLQEPLRTVSSFVKLLQQQYDGKLDDKTSKYFDFILQGSERMKILIKDLLEYSRIGKKNKREKIDCSQLVKNVIADLGTAIYESKAVIEADELPVIHGYPTEVKQLFQNIVINSVKFRKPGITPEIRISVQKLIGFWQFCVKDNGIGIDKMYNEKIFVIFQRLHTRSEYEGSGIGLAHCKKIVELHGGRIWIESEPGEGTAFYFTIPQ